MNAGDRSHALFPVFQPPKLTSKQRDALTGFVGVTQADRDSAMNCLEAFQWNLEVRGSL